MTRLSYRGGKNASRRLLGVMLALLTAASGLAVVATASPAGALPDGFTRELVSNVPYRPISIRFLPDGQALVSEKRGNLLLIDPRVEPATVETFMAFSNINDGQERGLIDFALDPDYATNGKFYVYYSPATPGNFRVSAFTDTGTAAGRLATEQVLWTDSTGYISCCHYGAGLDIGPDGKLWLTPGDKFDGARAQDLSHTDGKVIRFNTDGSIPDGLDGWPANPYLAPGDGIPDEIWAYGLRNPFRARWDIPTGRFFIGEVGGNVAVSWEDIHVSGLDDAGVNYGWPYCEGLPPYNGFPDCAAVPHEDPIFAYPHSGTGASVTVGPVYRGGAYPPEFTGALFYGDYARKFLRFLTFDGAGNPTDNAFDDAAGLIVGMDVGPDGMLYAVDLQGALYRYRYSGNVDQPPGVTGLTATPSTAPVGAPITFDAALVDSDTGSLSYQWNFGDGTTQAGTSAPGPVSVSHTFTTGGLYDVTLEVSDGTTTVTSDPVLVQVGDPPTATITTPADGTLFVAGDVINFTAPAPQPGETYTWDVVFTHNNHTHPVIDGLVATSGSFEVATSGHDYSGDTGYRIILTVANADGLFTSTSVDVVPTKVNVAIDTIPSGLTIDVDGIPRTTPGIIDTLVNFEHRVVAQTPRCVSGTSYDFVQWADGTTSPTRTFLVPSSATSLVAEYATGEPCTTSVPVTDGLALRLSGGIGVTTSGSDVVSWEDQSGNGNHVTPIGGAPVVVPDALNGNDVISFDGIDDALGRTGFFGLPTGAADRTVFVVAKYDSNGWGGFGYGRHSCNQAFGTGVSNNGSLAVQGWCNDFSSSVSGVGEGWLSQSVIIQANAGSLYRNSSLVNSFTHTFATGTVELRIGSELDDSPKLDMDVAEILVYDRALTPAEHGLVQTWIENTYLNVAPPAGPDITLTTPAEGQLILGNEVTATWSVSGASAGDLVEVSLDGGTPVVSTTSDSHTFTGVTVGQHQVTVQVTDSAGTPYSNPEATGTVTVNVQESSTGGSLVPVTSGLVLDVGNGANFVTDGATVLRWLDGSGNGNDMTAAGDPSLGVITPTGIAAVSFDGVDDLLERANPLGFPANGDDRTVFVVARYNGGKFAGVTYGNSLDRQAFGLTINGKGNLMVNGWKYNTGSSYQAKGMGWLVQSAVVETNVLRHYVGTQLLSSNSRFYETNPLRVVLGNDLGTNYTNMDIAAVLVYDRALSAAEHTLIADYLSENYLTGAVADTTPPVITLSGESMMTVLQGSVWSEPGYTATDNVDGDLTASVVVGGDTVDTAVLGDYVITYNVSDAAGNAAATVARTVTVAAESPPPPPPTGLVDPVPVALGLVLDIGRGADISTTGDLVTGWLDGSGQGNHLDVVGGDPSTTLTPTGVPAVSFDGMGDKLERTGSLLGLPANGDDRTMFVVARYRGGKFGGAMYGNNLSRQAFGLTNNGKGQLTVNGWSYNTSTPFVANGAGWVIHSAVVDANTLTQFERTQLLNQTARFYETNPLRLVLGNDLGSNYTDVDIAAVLIYNRALTTTEREQIVAYLDDAYLT